MLPRLPAKIDDGIQLAGGLPPSRVAASRGVSASTVRTHRTRLRREGWDLPNFPRGRPRKVEAFDPNQQTLPFGCN